MGYLVLLLVILLMLAALPVWPYSKTWGYFPSIITGVLLAFVLALIAAGLLP